ncbi:hypothetical protein HaLaN_09639 [Haematococcus lacustris]|uniref:Uncharacterized protein n=1 Tax=Haematococcus lacustris TaxID=44745 RepID=A0A699YU67_HAELA|nr:hypothetical protein HaLaN_09639 [Haematococcus lacustris]
MSTSLAGAWPVGSSQQGRSTMMTWKDVHPVPHPVSHRPEPAKATQPDRSRVGRVTQARTAWAWAEAQQQNFSGNPSCLKMPPPVLMYIAVSFPSRETTTGAPGWLEHQKTSACKNVNCAWPQVIKVPGSAVLRGCEKTKRKLMAHF